MPSEKPQFAKPERPEFKHDNSIRSGDLFNESDQQKILKKIQGPARKNNEVLVSPDVSEEQPEFELDKPVGKRNLTREQVWEKAGKIARNFLEQEIPKVRIEEYQKEALRRHEVQTQKKLEREKDLNVYSEQKTFGPYFHWLVQEKTLRGLKSKHHIKDFTIIQNENGTVSVTIEATPQYLEAFGKRLEANLKRYQRSNSNEGVLVTRNGITFLGE